MSPEDLWRDRALQDKIIEGIQTHGYDTHPRQRSGLTREEFGDRARQDLMNATQAKSFRDDNIRVLAGDKDSGRVIAANLTQPHRSSTFAPSAGVERYFANTERAGIRRGQLVEQLDLQELHKEAGVSRGQVEQLNQPGGASPAGPSLAAPKLPGSQLPDRQQRVGPSTPSRGMSL